MSDQAKMTIVEPDGKEYSFWTSKGKSVWEVLEIIGWDTKGACGGLGTCGKCKFRLAGGVSELSPSEREHLIPEEIKNGQRLVCLATVKGDFTLYIDYWQSGGTEKNGLLRYRYRPGILSQSQVRCKEFFVPGRQKDYPTPIYDRIKGALADYRLELSIDNINYLIGLDRLGRPTLELHALIFDDDKVQYVGRQREVLYGLALDIGSTSLFAALLDLETGQAVAMASQSNMQRIYGDDIISRVNYAMENEEGALTLHRILINNLNSMIEEMLVETNVVQESIYKVTAVGNPVMLHFLLGLNTSGFEAAPYSGALSEEMEILASPLGLKVSLLAKLNILPQLGGFVGADTTACLLTLSPGETDTFLMIDIGTNGEIVVAYRGKMWASSAAAGPAFEGGAISCGMRAGYGAIDKVSSGEGKLEFRVIGEGLPRGICGSGIIDLIAVLMKNGCLDGNGNFTKQAALQFEMRAGEHGSEIVLVRGEGTMTGTPLILNQEDIRQVQLARSAIRTAIDILLKKAKIDVHKLDNIYLAGAFGSYLDPANLLNIGLIPSVNVNKIRNIGNAAAEGAILALLSDNKFKEAAIIKSQVQYVELSQQEEFQEMFLKNISLSN
ncbi:MAG: hypothetical protein CVU90_01410 [Firmicutes bacterium HGW-Firmicutes-15]|nr:MAG: hypothetical protein CVU90_01410 [Firmicutes bacterium HGW-Firmicutes-15]